MAAIEDSELSSPSGDETERGASDATTGFDPSFGGTAIMAVMPSGTDATLVRRVQEALGQAIKSDDDPPVVVLYSDEISLPSDSEEEPDAGKRRDLWPVIIPVAVKIAKEGVEHLAREAKHQQRMNHAAERAHQKEVDAYHQRAEKWRQKNYG